MSCNNDSHARYFTIFAQSGQNKGENIFQEEGAVKFHAHKNLSESILLYLAHE